MLSISKFDPYQQSPYCILHNISLGLEKDHIGEILLILSKEEIIEIDRRISIFPKMKYVIKISKSIIDYQSWDGTKKLLFIFDLFDNFFFKIIFYYYYYY